MKLKKLNKLAVMSVIFANIQKGVKANRAVFARIEPGLKNLADHLNAELSSIGRAESVFDPTLKVNLGKPRKFPERVEDITSLINNWNDILNYVGETQEEFNARTIFDSDFHKATKEGELIALAYNQGKVLKYDGVTRLHYVWANVLKAGSGSGFSFDDCAYGHDRSVVGARLTFESGPLAEDAFKKFTSVYARIYNG